MAKFFKAKNRRTEKAEYGNVPITGEPNTNIDIRDEAGRIHRRRKLGESGTASKDIDFQEESRQKVPRPHAHDWQGKIRSAPGRTLTKKEMREAKKAERKRRFFKDDKR